MSKQEKTEYHWECTHCGHKFTMQIGEQVGRCPECGSKQLSYKPRIVQALNTAKKMEDL